MSSKSTSPNNPIHSHHGTTTHLPTNCRDPSKQSQMPITHSSLVFTKPLMRDYDSRYGLSNLNVNLLATNLWNHHQTRWVSNSEAEESKEEVEKLRDEMKGWWSWVTIVAIVSNPALWVLDSLSLSHTHTDLWSNCDFCFSLVLLLFW